MLLLQQQTDSDAVAAKHNAFSGIYLLSASLQKGQINLHVKFRNGDSTLLQMGQTVSPHTALKYTCLAGFLAILSLVL